MKYNTTSTKKYSTMVFLCRVQPLHNAHLEIIKKAASLADKVIVIIGSAAQPRTYKNPFTSSERESMVRFAAYTPVNAAGAALVVEHVTDTLYNDQAWASRIQAVVTANTEPTDSICLIGHNKDQSTFYLNMFPQWELEQVDLIEPLNATHIRDLYFKADCNLNFISAVVPPSVLHALEQFKGSEGFEQIVNERAFVEKYKQQYASLAYPPIFVTSDAVVVCSGHVLLIKRRAAPGKGLFAMPGGYVNANTDKSVLDAAIRELREETGIKVPEPVLRGSIVKSQVFDAINRSPRGRIITHCFYIKLPDGPLPKVKGSDDALLAKWVPISELDSSVMFEDHAEILATVLGV